MRKFVLMKDIAEVITSKPVEKCTSQDLFDAYMNEVDTCAKMVSAHDSVVEASEALFALNLKKTWAWAIGQHRAQVNVAYVQEIDLDDDEPDDLTCAVFGDICAARIGERTGC